MAVINPNNAPHQIVREYAGRSITKCVVATNKQGAKSFTVSTLSGLKETWVKKNGKWQPK